MNYKIELTEKQIERIIEWLDDHYQIAIDSGNQADWAAYHGGLRMLSIFPVDWERKSGKHYIYI